MYSLESCKRFKISDDFSFNMSRRQVAILFVITLISLNCILVIILCFPQVSKLRNYSQTTINISFRIRSLPLSLAGLKMLISSMNLARGMHHTRKQIALHAIDWLTFGLQTDGGGVKATTSPRFTQKISTTQPFLPEDSTPESMFMTVKILEKPEVCASEVTEGVIDSKKGFSI
ncbi:uncharacterized protein DC041_0003059 [Schistosoma bovis]|uniref:Uncharacterized protein n=1 Tax=Schistosoma bovis TaxID=6184 RepID=A0A430QGS7_SCHBO|nr:uncharacterized protein DC041_0003059 [Schistosoma bovis]